MRRFLLAVMCACGSSKAMPDAMTADAPEGTGADATPIDAAAPDAPPDAPPDADLGVAVTIRTYADADPKNAPLVAALHDGSTWVAVSGVAGVYTFSVVTERYGVAVVCRGATDQTSTVKMLFATTAELTEHDINCGPDPAAQHQISGTITGWNSNLYAVANTRGGRADVTSASYAVNADATINDFALTMRYSSRLLLDRGVPVAADVVRNVDVASAFVLEDHNIQFTGAQTGDSVSVEGYFLTSGGTAVDLPGDFPVSMVPSAQQTGNDIHYIVTRHNSIGATSPGPSIVRQFVAAPKPLIAPAAPTLAAPAVTTFATAPYKRLLYTFTPTTNVEAYTFGFTVPSYQTYVATATTGWLDTATTFVTPDLSGVVGWNTAWSLPAMTGSWWLHATHSAAGLAVDLYDPLGRPPRANLDGNLVLVRERAGNR